MPPKPNGFMADIVASFVQLILHIAKEPREVDIQHYRQADDLFARIEVIERVTFLHQGILPSPPAPQQAKLL
jgi:hypothetical protein